jgi:outer membrane lipoprotein-sorting protein
MMFCKLVRHIGISCSFLGAIVFADAQGHGAGRQNSESFKNLPEALTRAMRASLTLKYSGERRIELRMGPERIRNFETIWKDGSNRRIEYDERSTFRGQIIVEKGKRRFQYFPDKNEIHVSGGSRDEALHRLTESIRIAIRERWTIAAHDAESIAGVKTQKISMTKSNGQVMQNLWIDPKSGLILKRELYDSAGTVQGSFEFTKVNLRPTIRQQDFELHVPGAKVFTPTDLAMKLMQQYGFVKLFLANGEGRELDEVRVIGDGQVLILHYSTPNGILSFIQTKGQPNKRLLERARREGESVFAWERGKNSLILIGRQTEADLRALSLKTQER